MGLIPVVTSTRFHDQRHIQFGRTRHLLFDEGDVLFQLLFEIREEKLEEYIAIIKDKMSGAAELYVPLVVEAGTGDNWDQAH